MSAPPVFQPGCYHDMVFRYIRYVHRHAPCRMAIVGNEDVRRSAIAVHQGTVGDEPGIGYLRQVYGRFAEQPRRERYPGVCG